MVGNVSSWVPTSVQYFYARRQRIPKLQWISSPHQRLYQGMPRLRATPGTTEVLRRVCHTLAKTAGSLQMYAPRGGMSPIRNIIQAKVTRKRDQTLDAQSGGMLISNLLSNLELTNGAGRKVTAEHKMMKPRRLPSAVGSTRRGIATQHMLWSSQKRRLKQKNEGRREKSR